MAAHRTFCGKVIKFGTKIEDSLNINHSKFGVSNSNSLAPPLVQIFTYVHAKNFGTVRSRRKIFFSSESLAHGHQNVKFVRSSLSLFLIIRKTDFF